MLIELVQADHLHAQFPGPLGRHDRVVDQHFHLQPHGPVGHYGADIAAAHHAQGLASEFHALELFLLPLACVGGSAGLRYMAGQRHHHGYGVLGGGNGIAERRVHDHHFFAGAGGHVYIVHAAAGPGHGFKPGRRGKQVAGERGGRAHYYGVELGYAGLKLLRLHARPDHRLQAPFPEDFLADRVGFVGYKDFFHFIAPCEYSLDTAS